MYHKLFYYYWFIRTIPYRKGFYWSRVMSLEHTINEIIQHRKSISRFGDGEFRLLFPTENLIFQKENILLKEKLIETLSSKLENLIVAIPESFSRVQQFEIHSKYFWIKYFNNYGKSICGFLQKNRIYGNAFISRFYISYSNKNNAPIIANKLKKIWEGQDVLFVEGEFTRLGIGNDLFSNTNSIKRILCPQKNAFEKYHEILEASKKYGKDKLIIISLGPTATVLAHDLAKEGFWALDLGHIDIEYLWMKMNATYKVPIPGKYVSESLDRDTFEADQFVSEDYQKSVIYKL